MKLKTVDVNGKTYAEVQDGKPVFEIDGKDVAFDAAATVSTISRVTDESKKYKERAQTAEQRLTAFDGITDPAAALKALATVKNLDDKKLVDAGEVEKVKQAAIESVEAKYKPVVEKAETLERELYGEKIGGAFSRSPLIVGDKAKFAIPADLVQAKFGSHFAIENGKVVAKGADGNVIYSRAKPGEHADFDEALEIIVDQYPHKDAILRGTGGGSGARPGSAGGGGAKTVTRAEFDALSHVDRAAKVKDGFKVVDA